MLRAAFLVTLVLSMVAAGGAGAASVADESARTYVYGSRASSTDIARKLAQAPSGFSGGPVTATNGETVTVYVQNDVLAVDPAAQQKWADILTGLVHGPEISTFTLYLVTLDQVRQICGQYALGCYGRGRMVAIDQDLPGLSARAVVTHEYGHHVADSRDNAPWAAIDYGTKRWASYVGVCARAKSGELAPGNEEDRYQLNPGEAFAEDYRLLNERRQGLVESPWAVVDDRFYPDQTALDLLAQDVTTPWTGNTTTTFKSSFTARATGRGFPVSTPLDGTLEVTLTSPAKSVFTLRVVDKATGALIGTATGPDRIKKIATQVCGQRTVQFQVKRVKGAGAFSLTVSKA